MKVLISCDIEGCAGIASWDEISPKDGKWYSYFCRQMSLEAAAACKGAAAAGATDILVKDAHGTARNIDPSLLPKGVQINRGWNGGLFSMVAGLSKDFDALAFVGYHSHAGSGGNPLSHSMALCVEELTINDEPASEFIIHSYIAGMLKVPVVFVSADAALCKSAKDFLPAITAVAVSAGAGNSSTSAHPDVATDLIREGMEKALGGNRFACHVKMPANFKVNVRYQSHALAFEKSFYPGAVQKDEKTLSFENKDYYEILRFFHFVL